MEDVINEYPVLNCPFLREDKFFLNRTNYTSVCDVINVMDVWTEFSQKQPLKISNKTTLRFNPSEFQTDWN